MYSWIFWTCPFSTVESSAKLGNACQLHPGSHIFGNTEIGDQCILMTWVHILVLLLYVKYTRHLCFSQYDCYVCAKFSSSGAVVDLPGSTVIGCNNVIWHHSVVGIKCKDMKYKVSSTSTDNDWCLFPVMDGLTCWCMNCWCQNNNVPISVSIVSHCWLHRWKRGRVYKLWLSSGVKQTEQIKPYSIWTQ